MARIPYRRVPEHPDDHEDEPENISTKQLNALADELLAAARPDRYQTADKDWQSPVVLKVAEQIRNQPPPEIVNDAAERLVRNREGMSTRKGNQVLRRLSDPDQLPLDLDSDSVRRDLLRHPIVIEESGVEVRVRLGAASESDLEAWVMKSVRDSDNRQRAEAASRDGARRLIDGMRRRGVHRVEDFLASPGDSW